ncbi:MAG: hypothetical protein V3T28_12315, partial [Gemmatimonadales bacterium]
VPAAKGRDAVLALAVATITMVVVVLLKPGPLADLAWPWYVPLGLAITIATGVVSTGIRTRVRFERRKNGPRG